MKIEIKHWMTGSILFEGDFSSLADAVVSAVSQKKNLEGAYLEGAYLEGAYLKKFPPVPIIKNIDSKILAAVKADGNHLDMSTWHSCGTTHCRGGWAVTLAGKAGKKLEDASSAELAAILIYAKSRKCKPIPNFYATNEDAMQDLERCAAEEQAAGASEAPNP